MSYEPNYNVVSPIISNLPEPIELGNLIEDGRRGDKLSYNGENHLVIFGKPGSGKDTRLILPNLMRLSDRSIFAVDTPKGEMAAVTAPQRAKYGKVYILNFFGVLCDLQGYGYMEGCGFNPMCALSPTSPDFNMLAGLLSDALIEKTASEKQPFFPNMARAMTAFCIMYECLKAKEQGRDPLLSNVRRMLCEEADSGIPATVIGGEVVKQGTPAKGIPAYAQEVVNSPIPGLRNKAGMLVKWTKSLGEVAATAQSETEFLDDPEMAYGLSRNDVDFRELKKRVTTVYLVLPADAIKRHSKFLRMALTIALTACQRQRAAHEPRVVFFLNEYYTLGFLQPVEDNYTVVRGAGIQIVIALHSIGQMKRLHDKNWETMLGSTDAVVTFAPNDIETAEWFSKRAGETGKMKTTVTENWAQNSGNTHNQGLTGSGETSGFGTSGGWSYSKTASHSYEKEPAVTTYDLYNMQPGEMRVIAANMGDTLHVHAPPYFKNRALLAEIVPPENPYNPKAVIPRIARRVPDYAAFQRQMIAALPPAGEVRQVEAAPFVGEEPFMSNPPFFSGLKAGGGASTAPQAAPAQMSPWLNPTAYVDNILPVYAPAPPPAQNGQTVNINFINSGSGTMNFNFGAPVASGQDIAIPAPPVPFARPLTPPTPLPPLRQPQAPDSIRRGAQAQHPGYSPEPPKMLGNYAAWRAEPKAKQPPKHGGDDWAYDDDA